MTASCKVVLALAGMGLAVRAQAQTVVVGPQAASMALVPGAQVTVPIVANLTGSGGASLGSITARLLWHPTVLAFRGVGAGAMGAPVVNVDTAGGSLRFALANPAGVSGQPVLLNAMFAVVGAAGATDTLKVSLQELTRAGTFADLLPIGTATSSLLCVSTGLFGDLDGSGAVTSADALVILTAAVGLPIAPHIVVNGDVDGDGQVNTRDALIVLSYAIGLPVGSFRVARLNPGACAVQAPASVQIQPRTATVSVGDRLPLAAVVKDSAGAVVQGVGLVWASADTTVAKTDAAGYLVGVGPGTTKVYANAAPGLKDSVTVSVSFRRYVWYVNPAVAALNGGVELGSWTYPFSSIGQAVSRAAAFDSVYVAPAVYGEGVHLTKTIFVIGDSTAAGRTIIRNPVGPAVVVDSLPSGGVRLDHLWIEDSQGGVIVNGSGAGVVSLNRLVVARSRGVGISVRRVGQLMLNRVAVQGAANQGIEAESVAVVTARTVWVDVVGATGGPPRALRVAYADTVTGDSLFLATAGVRLDSIQVASLGHFRSRGAVGAALWATIGTSFTLDSADVGDVAEADSAHADVPPAVAVELASGATARIANATIHHSGRPALGVSGGDSVLVSRVNVSSTPWGYAWYPWTVAFYGTRRVAVEYSSFADNNGAHVGFEQNAVVTVDTSAFQATALNGYRVGLLDVRRTLFGGTAEAAIRADSVRTLSLVLVDVSRVGRQPDYSAYGGPFAVDVSSADSLHLDALTIHDNAFGAAICRSCRAVQATASAFLRNGQHAGYLAYGRIGTLVLEAPTQAVLRGLSIEGQGTYGVWLRAGGNGSHTLLDSSDVGGPSSLVFADQWASGGSFDSLTVTRSAFHGRNVPGGYGVQVVYALTGLTVSGSTFDSTANGLGVTSLGPATISGNTFTGMGQEALQASYSAPIVFDSNAVAGCVDPSASDAVHLYQTSGRISRNVIVGCLRGVWSESYLSTRRLAVVGNTIRRDSTFASDLVHIANSYDSVAVVGNTILGGRGAGLNVYGSYYGIGAARVDSNTVRGVLGNGVVLGGSIAGPVRMTYNVIADNDTNGLVAFVPVVGSYNTLARNRVLGATFSSAAQDTFRLGNYVGNGHFAVVSASGGLLPVVADSSYWGRTTGPRYPADTSTVAGGDSVGLNVTFLPYDSALVAHAPPIPGPLAAPGFRSTVPSLAPRRVALPAERPRSSARVLPRRVQP